MRYLIFTVLLMIGITPPAIAAVKTGEVAPNFTAIDSLSGKPVTLSALKGKTVVLEWTNYGCPFVKKHYSVSNMQNMQRHAKENGVVWVSVNSGAKGRQGAFETDDLARQAVKEKGAEPAYYIRDIEGEIGRLYGARTTPHMFVINQDGVLVYQGAIDSTASVDSADIATSKNYVSAVLAQLQDGKPVTVKDTKPYGCSVKYSFF